jgi:hypothetical protein
MCLRIYYSLKFAIIIIPINFGFKSILLVILISEIIPRLIIQLFFQILIFQHQTYSLKDQYYH